MAISLSTGNEKLNKPNGELFRIIGFGIPADYDVILMGRRFNTCPNAAECKDPCYAKRGRYAMPNVKNAKRGTLVASVLPNVVPNMVATLSAKASFNAIRVHDAGDFYSQEYLEAWYAIARAMPDRTFYAYTKSLHLDFSKRPRNLRITQSLGGKFDKLVQLRKPHSRIFASHKARMAAGYKDGNRSDIPAIEGVVKIGLVYHGNKNLTESQKKYFG